MEKSQALRLKKTEKNVFSENLKAPNLEKKWTDDINRIITIVGYFYVVIYFNGAYDTWLQYAVFIIEVWF